MEQRLLEGDVEALAMYETSVEVCSNSATQDALLEVPWSVEEIDRFYTFRIRKSGEALPFPGTARSLTKRRPPS